MMDVTRFLFSAVNFFSNFFSEDLVLRGGVSRSLRNACR